MEVELEKSIKTMEGVLSQAVENAKKAGIDAEAATKSVNDLKVQFEAKEFATPQDIKTFGQEMQKQFDELATLTKKGQAKEESGRFDELVQKKLNDMGLFPGGDEKDMKQSKLFKEMSKADARVRIELPEVKTFGLLTSLTGDPVATYNQRQAILPSQKVNIRDLVSTVNTETGLYITFAETSTTNNIGKQAEGSTKGANDYGLTAVKIVEQYIAGTLDFTKQAMNSLPFLSQVMPRLLTRDFFKVENSTFYAELIAAASTAATTSETDKVLMLIDYIAYQESQNYNTSFALLNPSDYANLVKSTYAKGYYPGAGSVLFEGTSMRINDTPVVKASFATAGHVLIMDQDYVERVQVSGLAITLSYENNDNFVKNKVTARIECQEEINLMLGASAQYKAL